MNLIKRLINRVLNKYKIQKESIYQIKNNDSNEWVYICYIAQVFYHLKDTQYLDSHQNKREAIIIARTFHKLGYNVYIQEYSSRKRIPKLNFSIIFGIEPNFYTACEKFPKAQKIYYATGAYFEHQNKQIRKITDQINKAYHSNLPYKRLVKPHKSIDIADYILQIGSNFTIKTYPEAYRSKITLIHQSQQIRLSEFPKHYAKENEYFYLGSGGNALKGLSLLIEYFHQHTELFLNIVGPIEDEFYKIFHPQLGENIKIWGFLNINSAQFSSIIKKCNFIIYPSGSEGGTPGAVINSMSQGLIPMVTPWSAFDEINDFGFLMEDWSLSSIDKSIKWSLSLTDRDIEKLSEKNRIYATNYYNLNRFEDEFTQYIKTIIKDKQEPTCIEEK